MGSLTNHSLRVYCWVRRWKNFENQSRCGKLMGESTMSWCL